jgi:hypothetical protein
MLHKNITEIDGDRIDSDSLQWPVLIAVNGIMITIETASQNSWGS